MRLQLLFLLLFISGFHFSRAGAIEIKRNISYSSESSGGSENLLDVYYPKDISTIKDVLVFIHGGSWNSGKKETYWWLGRNMARKNVVAVIINYSLSPSSQYEKMASDCAKALKWVGANARNYGGDRYNIFVMGHSAGAHLAAFIHAAPRFFKNEGISDPIRGLILNDPFGLDMFEYLSGAKEDSNTKSFLSTFSSDPAVWKLASPIFYLKNFSVPVLLLVGQNTYPAIRSQSERLEKELNFLNKTVYRKIIPKKKHVPMIAQMIFKSNVLYKYILDFLET